MEPTSYDEVKEDKDKDLNLGERINLVSDTLIMNSIIEERPDMSAAIAALVLNTVLTTNRCLSRFELMHNFIEEINLKIDILQAIHEKPVTPHNSDNDSDSDNDSEDEDTIPLFKFSP